MPAAVGIDKEGNVNAVSDFISSAEMGEKTVTNTPAALFAGTSAVSGRRIMKIKVGDNDIRIRIGTQTSDLEKNGYPLEPGESYVITFDPSQTQALYAVSEGAHVPVNLLEY